jgi:hypothetical protein
VIQHYLQRHFLVKIYVSGAIEGEVEVVVEGVP